MGARARAQLALATATAVGTTFGVQGMSAALPAMQRHLGLSGSELGLVTAVYMLPAVLLAIPFGYLADVLGRRRVFVSMMLVWSLAGAAQVWARDLATLLALRTVQGIGFGALMPLTVTLIGDAVRGPAQLRAQASRQVAMTVGDFALPLVGAALAGIAWNAPLLAQGALLPLALAGVFLLDDRSGGAPVRGYADQLGASLRQRGMPAVLTAGFLRFLCKFALLAYLPFMLVHSGGASIGEAAFVLSAGSVVAALVSTQMVRALGYARGSRLLIGSVVLLGGSLVGLAVAPSWQVALGISVVFGLGDGGLAVLQNGFVTEAAPDAVRAGVMAVSGMTRNAGKLLAPLAVSVLTLVMSVPLAFAALGAVAWGLVPVLRPLRGLDHLLVPAEEAAVPDTGAHGGAVTGILGSNIPPSEVEHAPGVP
jgi:MFS transporter, ACDE family, multidrug resistance protein